MGFAESISRLTSKKPPKAGLTDAEVAQDQAEINSPTYDQPQDMADKANPKVQAILGNGRFSGAVKAAISAPDEPSQQGASNAGPAGQIPGMPAPQPAPVQQPIGVGQTLKDAASGQSLVNLVEDSKKYSSGIADAALTMATGAVAQPIGALFGIARTLTGGKYGTPEGIRMGQDRAKEIADSLTWVPKTQTGRDITQGAADLMDASKLQGLGPTEAISLAGVSAFPNSVKAGVQQTKQSVSDFVNKLPIPKVDNSPLPATGRVSVGAAAATNPTQARGIVANSSPELRDVVEKALKKGSVDLDTLARHAEADSVGVQLTKGQATQDLHLLSDELNNRAKIPGYADRFAEQNKALINYADRVKETAAPDVFATTIPEHGELLIDAYKAKDAALNKNISSLYGQLRDANGGQFPLDVNQFAKNAEAALHKDLLFDHVPPAITSTIQRLQKQGSMTFENFESLRTRLAAIQRSNADGNVKAAAGVIRQALEDLPMPEGAGELKTLADQARAAARQRFSLIESDPAYKAVVSGKAAPDNFVQKYVVGGKVNDLKAMKQNLAESEIAPQAMSSGAINFLKDKAGIVNGEGTFSQARYNKALEQLRQGGTLNLIFDPQTGKQLETLGNVARYTQAQPKGSYVNNSNTLVGALKEGSKSAAEGVANKAAGGIPVGSWVRNISQRRAAAKAANESLRPGAGILLKDVK